MAENLSFEHTKVIKELKECLEMRKTQNQFAKERLVRCLELIKETKEKNQGKVEGSDDISGLLQEMLYEYQNADHSVEVTMIIKKFLEEERYGEEVQKRERRGRDKTGGEEVQRREKRGRENTADGDEDSAYVSADSRLLTEAGYLVTHPFDAEDISQN